MLSKGLEEAGSKVALASLDATETGMMRDKGDCLIRRGVYGFPALLELKQPSYC